VGEGCCLLLPPHWCTQARVSLQCCVYQGSPATQQQGRERRVLVCAEDRVGEMLGGGRVEAQAAGRGGHKRNTRTGQAEKQMR
jgi:hypothetical protein